MTDMDRWILWAVISLLVGLGLQWRELLRAFRKPYEVKGNPVLVLVIWALLPSNAMVCAVHAWPHMYVQVYPGRAFLIAFLTCLALLLIRSYCRSELDTARTWPIWRMRAAVAAGYPALLILVAAIGHTYQ